MYSKLCVMLISEIALESWAVAAEGKQENVVVRQKDVDEVIRRDPKKDFLVDVLDGQLETDLKELGYTIKSKQHMK